MGHDGSKSIHHSIRDLPEDDFLHWKKVKEWIKECSSELAGIKSYKHSKVQKERMEYADLSVYIDNMKRYLNHGHWSDFRYGANEKEEYNVDVSQWRTMMTGDLNVPMVYGIPISE